ncbi:MAG: ABC transporter permease, partial [Bryobacteraceae bacterium]
MLDDIRFALRLVRKNAGLSVAAALLLALGLGGNSAVFALIYLVFERPLPGVHDAGQLVFAGMKDNQREWQSLSYPFYKELRDRNEVFRETAVLDFACFHVADAEGDDRRAEKLCGRIASWNVFDVLGTKMALGRTFRKDEDEVPGRDAVAILSHRVWQRRWNGDPAIVGRKIALNGHSFTILGITDPSFGGPFVDSYDDVWIPVAMAWPTFRSGRQTLEDQGLNRFLAIGRLKAGVKMEEAGAHLATLGRAVLGEAGRDTRNKTFALEAYSPIGPGVPGEFRLFLGVLLGVAGIALLVVCANIANLLIARSTARQRELAIRLAVGASRTRVVRQMLTEGLVLALLGGVPGVVVCIWCAELLPKLFPPAISGAPFEIRVPVDGPVLLYAALLCGVSALAFALPAAIKGARPDLASSLKAGEPDATPRRIRLRDTLAVAQIALCLSLLVIAGLLSGSFNKLRTSDPKMRVDGLLLASVEPALNGYTGARLEDLLERMHERVAATPGVESASMGMVAPFAGNDHDAGPVIGGDKPDGMRATFNIVGPDYFRTLDIALLRGREFRLDDRRGRPRVAIINETFARRMWPKDDPLGQTFRLKGSTGQPLTVVGVARDSIYVDAK